MPGYLQNPMQFRLLVLCHLVSVWFQRPFLNMESFIQWKGAIFHSYIWRTDILSFTHLISSIWSSLCHCKFRHKLFSLITKIYFNLDKCLSHAENSLETFCFLTWKSSKCYGLLQNLVHKLLQIGQKSQANPLYSRLERKPWTENTVFFRLPLRLERPLGNGKWERKLNDTKRLHKPNVNEISHPQSC